jgi:NADH-quinone oxidoreductase subunit C
MPAPDVCAAVVTRYEATEYELGVQVSADVLRDCLQTLRDAYGYSHYMLANAIDRGETIEEIHGLRKTANGEDFFVKVVIPADRPEVSSAVPVFPGAEWHEREILDLFGVTFIEHPDPRRIMMPDDYVGHPLRKEFKIDTPWGYRPPTPPEAS